MHLYTTSIAVFPVTAIGYTRVIKPTQSNELVAGSLIENIAVEKPTKSSSPSDKQIHGVSASSIFFVEAVQDYVNIYYEHTERMRSKIVRSTIKDMISQISDTTLLKCHRSYIVNTEKIEQIEGNA